MKTVSTDVGFFLFDQIRKWKVFTVQVNRGDCVDVGLQRRGNESDVQVGRATRRFSPSALMRESSLCPNGQIARSKTS